MNNCEHWDFGFESEQTKNGILLTCKNCGYESMITHAKLLDEDKGFSIINNKDFVVTKMSRR